MSDKSSTALLVNRYLATTPLFFQRLQIFFGIEVSRNPTIQTLLYSRFQGKGAIFFLLCADNLTGIFISPLCNPAFGKDLKIISKRYRCILLMTLSFTKLPIFGNLTNILPEIINMTRLQCLSASAIWKISGSSVSLHTKFPTSQSIADFQTPLYCYDLFRFHKRPSCCLGSRC